MSSLVRSNEQRWNEQWYLSLKFTSYLHKLADENILRVRILRVYSLPSLLFFKIKHSIKFRATWLWISGNMTLVPGDMTSSEMSFGRLDRLPLWYALCLFPWNRPQVFKGMSSVSKSSFSLLDFSPWVFRDGKHRNNFNFRRHRFPLKTLTGGPHRRLLRKVHYLQFTYRPF